MERAGHVTGYASAPAFFGHATAETDLDPQALIASADACGGPGILVPTRHTALFRWCLAQRLRSYASAPAFFGHATAETDLDLQALIASADACGGPGILVPTRHTALFRWCLAQRLRIVQPMTLMSLGLYGEPSGAGLASILF